MTEHLYELTHEELVNKCKTLEDRLERISGVINHGYKRVEPLTISTKLYLINNITMEKDDDEY